MRDNCSRAVVLTTNTEPSARSTIIPKSPVPRVAVQAPSPAATTAVRTNKDNLRKLLRPNPIIAVFSLF